MSTSLRERLGRLLYPPAPEQDLSLSALLADKKGILLDISFGGVPQDRSVTLSPAGNLPHDPREIPFPLPDACVNTAVITHVLEYLDPETFFAWFDELHRVVQRRGTVYISGPYGGDESHGWVSDPTHRIRIIEQTFLWLDPRNPFYALHLSLGRKNPKPWNATQSSRVPGAHGTYSYNIVLERMDEAV